MVDPVTTPKIIHPARFFRLHNLREGINLSDHEQGETTAMTEPTRQQREAAGLVHVAAWLTEDQAEVVTIWEYDNLAHAAKQPRRGRGRPPKPPKPKCTCGGEA